jgi:type II secretion system protein H
MQRQQGLTLLELLVVLAIIGFAMAGVSLALRDSSQTQLEREAQRLVAVLEAARAQSRTSGIALIWQATPDGFVIRPALTANQAPCALKRGSRWELKRWCAQPALHPTMKRLKTRWCLGLNPSWQLLASHCVWSCPTQ